MKKVIAMLAAGLFLSVCVNTWAAWMLLRVDEIIWPSIGKAAITVFNGNANDGSLVVNGKLPNQRTGLDFWPVNGTLPSEHALTEMVFYATRFQDWPTFERFSISQIAGNSHIRFGVERGGNGQFRDMLFCFDDITPGVGDCKFKISLSGVFVRNNNQWIKIGE